MLTENASLILSLGAFTTSLFTTYMSFFAERFTLNASIDRVSADVRRGASSNGELKTVTFQYYVTPGIILSHQGNRPVVVTDVQLVNGASARKVRTAGDAIRPLSPFETIILEPGSVRRVPVEFQLPNAEATSEDWSALTPRSEAWLLRFTVFDHKGRRREPLQRAFAMETHFTPPAAEDDYPTTSWDIDFPRRPTTLASRGLL